MRGRWLPVLAGAAALGVGGVALGLDEPDAGGSVEAAPADPEAERAELRARLERALERAEASVERHREALERLDAGESPAEVLRSARKRPGGGRQVVARQGAEAAPPHPTQAQQRPHRDRVVDGDGQGTASAERTERLRAFLREHLPSVHEQISQIERADAEAGRRLFARLAPQLGAVMDDTDRDPEFGALRLEELRAGLEVVDATHRLRSLEDGASEADRVDAERGLRDALARRFDAKIRLREHEVRRLAGRLAEMHRAIREQQSERDAEIERAYRAVTGERWARPAAQGG